MNPTSFTNPLAGVVLGDPFVLRHHGRFYLFGTNDGPAPADGRVVPVYRSDDLIHWELLGGALEPLVPEAEHWAPEVLAWNGRFYMVVSFGDVERQGHALWVAVADRPEGPYRFRSRISDPSERFSIDGSWLLDDDGRLYLFRCLDFIEAGDPPHGTGIVVQPMRDPLTPSGPPAVVLRAHAPWQVFETDRVMPLYGGLRFAVWTTIEGPAPVRRGGRYYCGYSGGNYSGAYGTGETVADSPLGPYQDLRGREGPIFGTIPGLVEGPGHFSVIRPDLVHDWIVLHGRKPGEPGRRVWLCPASWGAEGVTIGALTDRPQPAPALPTELTRFDAPPGTIPDGWRLEPPEAPWRCDGEGLRHGRPASHRLDSELPEPLALASVAWRETVILSGAWVIETVFRFPEGPTCSAGVALRSDAHRTWIWVDPARGECQVHRRPGAGASIQTGLPTLGVEPFDPKVDHALEIRARSGRAEVRIDGVLLCRDRIVPEGPTRFGLLTSGVSSFNTVTVTLAG